MAKPNSTAPAASSDDLFEDVVADYVTVDDLEDRHIVVIPDRIESATGKNGDPYDRIVADVIVLDGPVTDKITEIPFTVTEMYLSAKNVVGRLRASVRDHKVRLGFIDSVPSSFNKNVKAFGIQPVGTDQTEIRAKANAAVTAYREAAHAADPFAA
jgi:hypothetical protein